MRMLAIYVYSLTTLFNIGVIYSNIYYVLYYDELLLNQLFRD